jgi:hypothetical protein
MNIQSIEEKIVETQEKIIEQYPNSCTSCSGRGGRIVPSYEGCYEINLCEHCVLKGLDPLDMTKDLIPFDYEEELGSDYIEECLADGYDPHDVSEMDEYETLRHYKRCISPTQGEGILYGAWTGLPTLVQNLLDLKEELSQIQTRYENLVLSEDI